MKITLCKRHEYEYHTLILELMPAASVERVSAHRLDIILPCKCELTITGNTPLLNKLQAALRPVREKA